MTPASSTPGIFPREVRRGPPRAWVAGTGSYSLTIEADETGPADGTRYIGTLAAGECRMQYWLFSYPQCVNVLAGAAWVPDAPLRRRASPAAIKPDDDLSLDYDVWATTTTAPGARPSPSRRSFTMRNEISASANKIWPNTTSKVPDEYLAAIAVRPRLGDARPRRPAAHGGQPRLPRPAGDHHPGHLVRPRQRRRTASTTTATSCPTRTPGSSPSATPASFDADCFRLVNVYGIVIVKLKTGGELLIPFQNQLYFENLPDNTGVVGLVYYQYVATDAGCTRQPDPVPGGGLRLRQREVQRRLRAGLGLASGSYGSKLGFTKTDGVTAVAPGATLTYTITADNSPAADGGPARTSAPRTSARR